MLYNSLLMITYGSMNRKASSEKINYVCRRYESGHIRGHRELKESGESYTIVEEWLAFLVDPLTFAI